MGGILKRSLGMTWLLMFEKPSPSLRDDAATHHCQPSKSIDYLLFSIGYLPIINIQ